jgi:hypothetical protein
MTTFQVVQYLDIACRNPLPILETVYLSDEFHKTIIPHSITSTPNLELVAQLRSLLNGLRRNYRRLLALG